MLAYNLDLEEGSTWLRTTPGERERAQPFYATETGDFWARGDFFTERSSKNSFEIFYTIDGKGIIEQNGKRVTLGRGSALLIDSRQPQRYRTADEASRWHHLWTHIDGVGVQELAKELEIGALRPVFLAEPIARRHFSAIAENLEAPGIAAQTVVGLAVHSLLAEMIGAAQVHTESSTDETAIRSACQLIESAYAENITLDDLARTAQVSKSYLMKCFKKSIGATPYEYLLRYRINRAKELLAETDKRIGAIAEEVGFNSESNFSYRFAKVVGMSPRAYRASCPSKIEG